jgi:ornithine carbamoyltransferase
MTTPRHFINLSEIPTGDLKDILKRAHELKAQKFTPPQLFKGLSLAMMFDKRSTRTRMSFEVAMKQLGGHTVVMNMDNMLASLAESLESTSKVFSRYVDAVMVRISSHEALKEMSEHSAIPYINGMTDLCHPCQVMADMMTIEEKLGAVKGKKIVWLGDFNNMTYTFMQAADVFEFELVISCPDGLMPQHPDHMRVFESKNKDKAFAHTTFVNAPKDAAQDAHVLVTDTWVSQGQEEDKQGASGIEKFWPYQVNSDLMTQARSDAIFMHCLPIHEWEEVSESVAKSPASVIYDEAENRLHAQKAILAWCLEGAGVSV